MKREDFQDKWEEIVNKGYSSYTELSREERVWFNLEPLTTDGLVDHYINYGAEHNSDTIDDLKYLNQNAVADLMSLFNSKFIKGVPLDIDDRNDEIGEFSEEFVEEIDEKYWDLNDSLDESILTHIIKYFK